MKSKFWTIRVAIWSSGFEESDTTGNFPLGVDVGALSARLASLKGHPRGCHLYQHGMDLERISQWLGHSQLETTLIYAHADTEDKRKAIEAALGDGVTGQLNNAPYTVDDEEILRKLYGL